jgi:DNA-nicking Smr family endonuclease
MRRLSAEEQKLWARVVAGVRPIRASEPTPEIPVSELEASAPAAKLRAPVPAERTPVSTPVRPGHTLDGSWDRKLARGLVHPDMVLDLHGHRLDSAYHLLDLRLDSAIEQGARVVLLITGRPPGPERPIARGRIRAAIGDWLACSRHAGKIAAIRGAHPRHGGAGALYIILRRARA